MTAKLIPFSDKLPDKYIAEVGMGFFLFLGGAFSVVDILGYTDFDEFCDDIIQCYMERKNIADSPILKYVMRMSLEKHPLTKPTFKRLFKKKYG